jgi:hypothetical protein
MGQYSSLVGKRVEAYYRAGDLHLSAIGTLVADSGKCIFLEERFSQGGKNKTMRVEIPYEYLIRIAPAEPERASPSSIHSPAARKQF